MQDKRIRRILMSVLGVIFLGISVGISKRASLGVNPYQSLMAGLDVNIPITFGTLYLIVNIGVLLFAFLNDRSKIGIATVINLFLLGYIADFTHKLLRYLLPEVGLVGRLLLLAVSIVVMCLSSAFYFTADMGVSPYDSIALILSEKQNRVPFRYCRIISDCICVALGTALFLASGQQASELGQVVGIGTITTAFFVGPLIDFFNRKVARPFLDR